MDNKYKRTMDSIRISDEAVERALESVRNPVISETTDKKPHKTINLVAVIAASLAVVIALTAIFYPKPDKKTEGSQPTTVSEHGFILTANAAELKDRSLDSEVIGAFEGGGSMGFYFDSGNPVTKGEYPDFFQSFELSKLRIKGEDIKSVTVRAAKKGTYFKVTPVPEIAYEYYDGTVNGDIVPDTSKQGFMMHFGQRGVYVTDFTEEEYNKMVDEERKKYSDTDTLNNSQYTLREMENNSYSGFFSDYICDGFTYENKDSSDEIKLDAVITLMTETNQSEKNQKKLVGELYGIKKELDNIYATEPDGEVDTSDYQDLEKKQRNLELEILKEILKDASIEVRVSFTDGQTLSKTLTLEPDLLMGFAPWVIIKE